MPIQIIQRTERVSLAGNPKVSVIKRNEVVKLYTQQVVSNNFVVRDFSFTATQGQTVFELPSDAKANGLINVVINGTMQNQAGGDFTIEGNILTLSEGVDAGDTVYGLYQEG